MDAGQRAKLCKLLQRAGIYEETVHEAKDDSQLLLLLDAVGDIWGDMPSAPDENFWRDYFSMKGGHWLLTDEGWIPAECNTREHTGADPVEVLDEVNAGEGYGGSRASA